jgi:hypothetical protein
LRKVFLLTSQRYQEEHFACRTLVFEKGTIRLRCRSGVSFAESRFEDTSVITKASAPSFPGENNDVGEIEDRIQNYSERKLTMEIDIYRAFAGVGRQVRRQLSCDLCHGLPTRFFDWFLLWQPLHYEKDASPLERRAVAPSWSWAGWRGAVCSGIWNWYTRDMTVVRRGIRKRTWIIWHQRIGHASTECVPVRRHGRGKGRSAEGPNFYGGLPRKLERFPGIDCSATDPTPRTLTPAEGLPLHTEDLISEYPGSGFLQFWTISAVFELRFVGAGDDGVYGQRTKQQWSASESLMSSMSSDGGEWVDIAHTDDEDGEPEDLPAPDSTLGEEEDIDGGSNDNGGLLSEFDPDEQPGVKLIIGGKSGLAIGRIYVPTWWRGLAELDSASGEPHQYEFIVLCEARDTRAENFSRVDDDGGWRYRVMLVESKFEEQYYERVAIGSVGLEDLRDSVRPLAWKEFVLG